jgi:hypothetical protein
MEHTTPEPPEHWHAGITYLNRPNEGHENAHANLRAALDEARQNREALEQDGDRVMPDITPTSEHVIRRYRVESEEGLEVAVIEVSQCTDPACDPA